MRSSHFVTGSVTEPTARAENLLSSPRGKGWGWQEQRLCPPALQRSFPACQRGTGAFSNPWKLQFHQSRGVRGVGWAVGPPCARQGWAELPQPIPAAARALCKHQQNRGQRFSQLSTDERIWLFLSQRSERSSIKAGAGTAGSERFHHLIKGCKRGVSISRGETPAGNAGWEKHPWVSGEENIPGGPFPPRAPGAAQR